MSREPSDGTDATGESTAEPIAASVTSYKVLGAFTDDAGAGVIGRNDAGSGTPIGVLGSVPNAAGGYGLATPDDVRLEGTVDTAATDFVVEAGTTATGTARNVVAGHAANEVRDGAVAATVAGGGFADGSVAYPNVVADNYGTVGGGQNNTAGSDGDDDPTTAEFSTVGGGGFNTASGQNATVAGGYRNDATADNATVGGGTSHLADAKHATIAGGLDNDAKATVATVAGGARNGATANSATVGGGANNVASGDSATVPGGSDNTASGVYSFAAGRSADANGHDGAFVWSDSGNSTFSATGADQFLVDAAGGVGVGTDSPTTQLEVGGNSRTDGDHEVTGDLSVGGSRTVAEVNVTAELTTDQSIGGTFERVQFDIADDDWGTFDTTTGEFTAPSDGKYRVTVHLAWKDYFAANTLSTAEVKKGGFREARDLSYVDGDGSNGLANHSFSKVMSTAKGQIIETVLKQDTGTAQTLNGDPRKTYMCITKIG